MYNDESSHFDSNFIGSPWNHKDTGLTGCLSPKASSNSTISNTIPSLSFEESDMGIP